MFEAAGFRVTSSRRLSRGVQSSDVVIWAPDDFDLPDKSREAYFDEWISDGSNRTVVYIGRDFDATIRYWEHVVDNTAPQDYIEYRRQLAKAKSKWQRERQDSWLNRQNSEWFDWDFDRPTRTVSNLSGPWSKGIDATKLDLQVTAKLLLPDTDSFRKRSRLRRKQAEQITNGTFVEESDTDDEDTDDENDDESSAENDPDAIADDAIVDEVDPEESDDEGFNETEDDEDDNLIAGDGPDDDEPNNTAQYEDYRVRWSITPLLQTDDEVLAASLARPHWGNSRIIVITNGSWLLNMPLVNHERRKLAGKLIEECHGRKVVFLESGANPYISDGQEGHPFLHAFTVWPLNCILLHLTILGIVYCFSVFPIFGRPQELPSANLADFGKHLTAFGGLLAKSGNAHRARQALKTYRQKVHKESTEEPAVSKAANPFRIANASQSGNPFQQAPPAEAQVVNESSSREEPTS